MTSTVDRAVEDLAAPPHSTEAEEAVLGAVLKQGLALVEVAPFLRPEHFYRPQHRQVYAAMLGLFEQGQPIDYHTLLEELRRQGTEESSGGLSFLAELSLATPTAAHIEHYGRIVVEHATRRRYISAAQTVAELAWNPRHDLGTVKDRAEALVLGAGTETLRRQALLSPAEWTDQLLAYLAEGQGEGLAGPSTGLRDYDALTLGLWPGLHLLAASTGTGKTALGGQIALHVAEHAGPVVFVSMELTGVELGVRMVAVLTNLRKERLVTGTLEHAQQQEVVQAIERLAGSHLYLVPGSGFTSADVRAHTLRVQALEGRRPALVVVDYVQLLRDREGDGRSREQNVGAAARALKELAQELQVPVLALVQLNRDRKGRADKRPTLTDLRESGDLENTADSVIGLYRDELEHTDSPDKGLAELIVLKKRQFGDDVGTTRRLVWVGESYRDYAYAG